MTTKNQSEGEEETGSFPGTRSGRRHETHSKLEAHSAGVKMPSAGELVDRLKQAGMEALQKVRARRKDTEEGN